MYPMIYSKEDCMYHFYFSLPKNDRNPGTVFLPNKKSTGVPIIISCYGWNVIHWPKRMEEGLLDLVVKKHDMGFVTMELYGKSDERGREACGRWARNLADMVSWVRMKGFSNANRIGIFAFGAPAAAAMQFINGQSGASFVIAAVTEDTTSMEGEGGELPEYVEKKMEAAKIPVLFLQGTSDKVTIQSQKIKADELIRKECPETRSASIVFGGSDYYLYNVIEQAAGETVKWLKAVEII